MFNRLAASGHDTINSLGINAAIMSGERLEKMKVLAAPRRQ